MRIRTSVLSALSVSAAASAALGFLPSVAGASGQTPHSRQAKGTATVSSPLIDHGGKVLTQSNTYAIWWGPSSQFPGDAQTGLTKLLSGFGGSSYLAIANQYMRGAATNSTFITSLVDSSAPPGHSPSTGIIVDEVAKVLAANGMAADPDGIYFVFTSNFPHANFCAWHSDGTISGTTVQIAYMPNTAGVAGCDPGNLFNANSYSEGTRSIADSVAHEFMEATTDPVPLSGWADKNGQEIGDKCNFVYGSVVKLANKSNWQLQEEWSNSAGGCVQTAS
jgi:hypothetical protein